MLCGGREGNSAYGYDRHWQESASHGEITPSCGRSLAEGPLSPGLVSTTPNNPRAERSHQSAARDPERPSALLKP